MRVRSRLALPWIFLVSLALGVSGETRCFGQAEGSRSFYMGFSTTPAENVQRTYSVIKNHADLVSHSLVDGVPWPEAFRSSDYRTYSQDLQNRWTELRRATQTHVPTHKKYLVVSPIESTVPNVDDNTWSTTGLLKRDGSRKRALATWDSVFQLPLGP